jgi:UDP-MurNAc hydroxylase
LVPRIAANIGTANLIMGHYGGASPYPQCFPQVTDKHSAGLKVVEAACKMLVSAADAIQATKIMPFAGQYILGGRLSQLNDSRATLPLDQAVDFIRTITAREVVSVKPGGSIDLSEGVQDEPYLEPSTDIKQRYIERISKSIFPYEREKSNDWSTVEQDLMEAASPVVTRSKFAAIQFENSFVIGDSRNYVTINLDPAGMRTSVTIGDSPIFENITTILMPTELLRRLSTRKKGYKGFTPMHWNQADVGSHFIWTRKGEYDLNSHMLLNFFGV